MSESEDAEDAWLEDAEDAWLDRLRERPDLADEDEGDVSNLIEMIDRAQDWADLWKRMAKDLYARCLRAELDWWGKVSSLERELIALKAAAPPSGPVCASCGAHLGKNYYSDAPYQDGRIGDLCLACRKKLPSWRTS